MPIMIGIRTGSLFTTIILPLIVIFAMLWGPAGCMDRARVLSPVEPPEAAYWPTTGWRLTPPEQQGVDSDLLAQALHVIKASQIPLHSLMLIRHGYVILDAKFYPYDGKALHDAASVTKSVTATLMQIALEKGYLKDFSQPVHHYFPETDTSRWPAAKRAITIADLITMSSGLRCGIEEGEAELFAMINSPDWVDYSLSLPMATAPGDAFAYCSCNTHLLSAILSRATGKSALVFARQYLFEPLGINQVEWPADAQGVNHGWGDLRLHPHDMAKIGFLYLHQGNWDGDRLSTNWALNRWR